MTPPRRQERPSASAESTSASSSTFPALLRYWRHNRGMSQLDLASTADVSARHVSYLETGRSKPSRDMILRLAATLAIPLREQNTMLQAAGFSPQFEAPAFTAFDDGPIAEALNRMMQHHDPFPLTVLDRHYNVVKMNQGARRLLTLAVPGDQPMNACDLLFDPAQGRPLVENWEEVATTLLDRLHRERLLRPNDEALAQLLSRLMAYPDVPASFREQNFSKPSEAVVPLKLQLGADPGLAVAFFTTMTAFQAPQNVTLDEILIESYFPMDDATTAFCEQLAANDET